MEMNKENGSKKLIILIFLASEIVSMTFMLSFAIKNSLYIDMYYFRTGAKVLFETSKST